MVFWHGVRDSCLFCRTENALLDLIPRPSWSSAFFASSLSVCLTREGYLIEKVAGIPSSSATTLNLQRDPKFLLFL